MAEIFLDGEPVRFDGPVPSSLQDLLVLIERSLDASGRVLADVAIDGRAVDAGVDTATYAAASRVEITSLSLADALARIAGACARQAGALRVEAAELSQVVLRVPWNEVAPRLVAHGGRLGALLQDLGSLGSIPAMGALAGGLGAGMEQWIDAVTARDAAAVCLSFERSLGPLLGQVAAGTGDGDANRA